MIYCLYFTILWHFAVKTENNNKGEENRDSDNVCSESRSKVCFMGVFVYCALPPDTTTQLIISCPVPVVL